MNHNNHNYPSLQQFGSLVQLKDYRPRTQREYVRYVRRLGDHFQRDPAMLCETDLRAYFLHLRRHWPAYEQAVQ